MKTAVTALLLCLALPQAARASLVERRIWIETGIEKIKEQMCSEKMKAWRCLWAEATACDKVMREVYPACAQNSLPDLPEYIDGPETEAQAQKTIKDCMTAELAKKYVLPLSKEKMDEYNICTGVAQRQKPINPNLQKALDASKAMTANQCSAGSFYLKCYKLPERDCKDLFEKHHLGCAMQMEKDGISVKQENDAIQETAKKITECALQSLRKELSHRPKLKDKECD